MRRRERSLELTVRDAYEAPEQCAHHPSVGNATSVLAPETYPPRGIPLDHSHRLGYEFATTRMLGAVHARSRQGSPSMDSQALSVPA